MKKLRNIVFLVFAVIVVSCSSDRGGFDENDGNNTIITEDDYFEWSLDGQPQQTIDTLVTKSDNMFRVAATSAEGQRLEMVFNKWGSVGDVMAGSAAEGNILRINHHYFKSNYFDFEMVAWDQDAQKVKVTFSGRVYDENYDLNSAFSTIEGSFVATYTEVAPVLPGLGVSAEINGTEWHDTDGGQEGGEFPGDNLTLYASNGSQYAFEIVTNQESTETGAYNFGAEESPNKVKLLVYNTATGTEEEWTSTSGTLIITEKAIGEELTILAGTFSFTAQHPASGETVTISNGIFRQAYENY